MFIHSSRRPSCNTNEHYMSGDSYVSTSTHHQRHSQSPSRCDIHELHEKARNNKSPDRKTSPTCRLKRDTIDHYSSFDLVADVKRENNDKLGGVHVAMMALPTIARSLPYISSAARSAPGVLSVINPFRHKSPRRPNRRQHRKSPINRRR